MITAGEADGDAGGARDRALAERARAADVVLLGPNCLGVFDAGAELELVSNDFPHGPIGLISQSGNLALELGMIAADAGLGFSRFASVGNQADVQVAELIGNLADHDATELIAIYVEDFRDGRAFARAAEAATRAGKPVVLMAIEHTDATARAVASHTGALASDSAAIDAACRAAGIERVRYAAAADRRRGRAPARGYRARQAHRRAGGRRRARRHRRGAAAARRGWSCPRSPTACATSCGRGSRQRRRSRTRSTWRAAASRTSTASTAPRKRC